MKKILIVGATSLIAEHCARIWASRGESLFLVGRDSSRLNILTDDLKVRGAKNTSSYIMEASDFDSHLPMLEKAETALGEINTVLIAHGSLSNQDLCQKDVKLTLSEIRINALSVISLLTHIANKFETKKSGTIAIISSVSGEKGRASNYVYGSSKAMVTAFASGLRQRLHQSNVTVITIKPGYIDTPMTKKYKKGLLWTKPERVAPTIVQAIDIKREEFYLPQFWGIIMTVIKIMPTTLFKKLKL